VSKFVAYVKGVRGVKMEKCSSCGERLPKQRSRFCPNCGTPSKPVEVRLDEKKSNTQAYQEITASLKDASSFFTPNNLSTRLQRIPLGIRIGLPVTVGVLFAGLFVGYSIPGFLTPLTAAQMPSYSEAFSEEERDSNLDGLCTELNSFIPDEATLIEYQSRQETLDAIGNKNDGRKMRSLYYEEPWFQVSNEKETFVDSVNQAIASTLTKVVSSFELMGIDESNKSTLQKVWLREFTSDTKNRCEFSNSEETALQKLSSYDSAIASGISIAESAPWYPKGYFEIDENLAGNFTTGSEYVDCYECSYWTMDIVSRYGCPGGVYVELSILRGGAAVDWTNDSLSSLDAGQKGKLQFRAYLSGSGSSYTGRIAESSCY
jgi:predicted RNA-binding Zn-ribbon protein involved in translation (DUF1610 family)